MRQSDRILYRAILQRVSLRELTALYERTMPEYPALAEAIASELDTRLAGELHSSEDCSDAASGTFLSIGAEL